LRQVPGADAQQRAPDAAKDQRTLCGAHGLALGRPGVIFAQLIFDGVEPADLSQQPAGATRCAFPRLE
jgi:hypothetical protein